MVAAWVCGCSTGMGTGEGPLNPQTKPEGENGCERNIASQASSPLFPLQVPPQTGILLRRSSGFAHYSIYIFYHCSIFYIFTSPFPRPQRWIMWNFPGSRRWNMKAPRTRGFG